MSPRRKTTIPPASFSREQSEMQHDDVSKVPPYMCLFRSVLWLSSGEYGGKYWAAGSWTSNVIKLTNDLVLSRHPIYLLFNPHIHLCCSNAINRMNICNMLTHNRMTCRPGATRCLPMGRMAKGRELREYRLQLLRDCQGSLAHIAAQTKRERRRIDWPNGNFD
jgi:hypothetical protein